MEKRFSRIVKFTEDQRSAMMGILSGNRKKKKKSPKSVMKPKEKKISARRFFINIPKFI
jgi:hypothetical protein